ncbi:MAG: efflux RND transporter periplasmic adaptor subunit, partial [Planctomycetes bacterium]|nr:efflux RND transporter periplasmic adaptor subunit [Planctomycetota bacterium]
PQRPLVGRVARIGREVDRETRELLVDVSLDPVPDRFAIGQRVDLWIEIAKKGDVLRLPPAFVAYANGRAGAFVLEDGSAHFRPIEIGGRGRDWVEVVGGLDVGSLAVRPLDAIAAPLRDGDRIRPIEKSTP